MYKVITINGEDYKLEFAIEASLYKECIQSITELIYRIDAGQNTRDIEQVLAGISDIPTTAVNCFYAGLLEHHGVEVGDGKVPNLRAAKELARAIIKDEQSEISNFYDLMSMCVEQMGEDGFFDLIGLSSLVTTNSEQKRGRKKKATTTPKPIPTDPSET